MSDDSSEAKTRPASQQKLRKQRRDGQVAQATKLAGFSAAAVGLGGLLIWASGMRTAYQAFFDRSFRDLGTPLRQGLAERLDGLGTVVLQLVGPVVLAAVISAIVVTVLFHKGIPFSATPLKPDFGRLNPAQGFKRIMAMRNWVEFAIELAVLIVWIGAGILALTSLVQPVFHLHGCGLPCLGPIAETIARRLVYLAIGFFVVMAALDMLLQRAMYLHEQRMTNTEHKREVKDQYGSPEVRSARNRLKREARSEAEGLSLHAGVDRANMCFYTEENAVAIRYHPKEVPLPRVAVVARGREAALRLRKAVQDNGFRTLQDAAITNGCLDVRPGMAVPEKVFSDLALGMSKLQR